MKWFDRVVLGKDEDAVAERIAAKKIARNRNARPARQIQESGDDATQTQVGGDVDFTPDGGTEPAKAFIKVRESGVSDWNYSITVIYKGVTKTFDSARHRAYGESNFSKEQAQRNARTRARRMAKELRIQLEPEIVSFELEV